jgi:sugar phosphate isomerase/epimerase
LWAPLVRDRLGLGLVQFSFDLVDPMWPDEILSDIAGRLRRVPADYGIEIHSAFIGLAHYTFNQLLHPDPSVRDYAESWLLRTYRFAAEAGIGRVGGPLGAIASRTDGREPESLPESDYQDLIARMVRLAGAAQKAGLQELYVEPTPLRREWPWTIAQARKMMKDVAGTPVPWRLCPDWGHATFEPLYGRYRASMEDWLRELAPRIGMVHIQQTDFQYDRHWDFTEAGAVDPEAAAKILQRTGLGDRPVFLEVFYPFERDDRSVIEAVAASAGILKRAFG